MRTLSILGVIVVSVMFLARPSMADPDRRLALIKDCQHMLRQIRQLPDMPRAEMAALARELNRPLTAAGRIMSGEIYAPNLDAPQLFLNSAEVLLNEMRGCIQSAQKGLKCSLTGVARQIVTSYDEKERNSAFRDLSSFCRP